MNAKKSLWALTHLLDFTEFPLCACVFACAVYMFVSSHDLPDHPGLMEDTLNSLLYCYHIRISNQSIVVYVPFLPQHSFWVTYTKSSRILEGTLCISTSSWF